MIIKKVNKKSKTMCAASGTLTMKTLQQAYNKAIIMSSPNVPTNNIYYSNFIEWFDPWTFRNSHKFKKFTLHKLTYNSILICNIKAYK